MIETTRTLLPAKLRQLLPDQTGSSAIEYGLMLALVALGTTTVLGNAGSYFYNMFQGMISSVNVVWPT